MTFAPQPGHPGVQPPDADPAAIRVCLGADLARKFDGEWERTLDEAKQSKSLTGIHDLIAHWRHIAYQELRAPGAYHLLMAKADHTVSTGRPAHGSVVGVDIRAAISLRLAEAGLPDPRDGR